MKHLHSLTFLLGLLGLLFAFGPVHAQDLGDTVSAPDVFSYQAPKGWAIKDSPASKYKVCLDAPKNDFSANINVVTESFAGSLADYVAANKTAIKGSPMFQNLQVIDEKPFVTSSGTKGTRVVMKDNIGKLNLQQIFYFFDGAPGTKFVVTASCLVDDGDKYAPTFDASLMTFSPK